jgi:hypothetical protein
MPISKARILNFAGSMVPKMFAIIFFFRVLQAHADSAAVLQWMESFAAGSPKTSVQGYVDQTEEPRPSCFLSVTPASASVLQPYVSLCKKKSPPSDVSDYCIGMSVHPNLKSFWGKYEPRAMEVDQDIHTRVFHDEEGPNGEWLEGVEDDLLIERDVFGNVTRVVGSSSHFPGFTCILQTPPIG